MYIPPFTITAPIMRLVVDIAETIGKLSAQRDDYISSPRLRKNNQIKTIHSSLAIEHNSLSLQQVTDVIEGKHVLGMPNEIQEVRNALQAYQLMPQLNAFNEQDLLRAHGLMMAGLVERAGHYRAGGVGVFDGERCIHLAPPAERVPELMHDLFEWVAKTDVHPLISSCVFHYEFEFIHPFEDGNGRMGRFWQTMLLSRYQPMFAWIPVETIVKEHQQDYYDAIAQSDKNGDSTSFITFMLQCLLTSMKQYTIDKVADKVADKTERNILTIIRNNPSVTTLEMARRLKMSDSGVRKVIMSLKSRGLLRRIGANKNGHWEVVE